MSFDLEMRITKLEVKTNILQKETSEVLGGLHRGLLTLMQGTKISTESLAARLDQVELAIEMLFLQKEGKSVTHLEGTVQDIPAELPPERTEGVEL